MENLNDDFDERFLNENEDSELMMTNELKMFEEFSEEEMKVYNSTKRLKVATETYIEELKMFLTILDGGGKSDRKGKHDELIIHSVL